MYGRKFGELFDDDYVWEGALTSGLNYGGLLLDVLGDSKQNLVRNDVVLSEGSGDHIPRQEHSYSCSIASDGDSVPSSPLSLDMQDDMESECFPCIPLNRANQEAGGRKEPDQDVFIKSEPSSPPPSFSRPYISSISTTLSTSPTFSSIIKLEPESGFQIKQENGSNLSKPNQLSLLKPTPITTRILCPKVSIKLEDPSSSSLNSCNTAVSNNNISNNGSSMLVSRQRILPALRHTISSPLISTQLKGSSGVLYLTEEEKRTLISEGYPIPTKLPLSKAEERSLKKIRRKIKNKISAQESRRKKKEYMDSLERKYDIMQSEANSWKSKAEALQAQNAALAKQVSELQQKLNMATKTGSEISFILPESIDLEDNILQGKNRVSEFQELTANCLDIDVD